MTGPFQTEAEASALPAVQAVYAAFDRNPVVGGLQPHNYQMLAAALAAADVELGAYDDRILRWLAHWEPTTCAVIAGIISRANRTDVELLRGAVLAGNYDLSHEDVRTVLDALDVAADYKRDRAATCPDCDADPADLCGTCSYRLARADEYDALARRLEDR